MGFAEGLRFISRSPSALSGGPHGQDEEAADPGQDEVEGGASPEDRPPVRSWDDRPTDEEVSVFESIDRAPVEYLPTGDKALLIAWAVVTIRYETIESEDEVVAVLCLEDGTTVQARMDQIKFEYRYDNANQKWVDVSKIPFQEGTDVDADQEAGDDGGAPVPGPVPDADRASQGDPGGEPRG